MSQHVPAWKKIGLKLKYAKETADDAPVSTLPETTNGLSHAGAKRSREEDIEQDSNSAAKRNKQSQRDIRTESPAPRSILSGSQSPTKTPANRKAVSFSAETKADDGETGQNYFKAWAAGQPHTPPKPSTEILVPETPESAEKEKPSPINPQDSPAETKAETKAKAKAAKRDKKKADQAAALTQNPDVESMPSLQERRESKAAKKAAKQERKAQEQQPAATQPQGPSSAYVEYLHQFHHDKTTWKFNKSKENHLLKSIWSMYRVPAPYTDALVSYIAGLQGAGARTRLVEGADEVLRDVTEKGGQKFEFNGYEESETRREAYTAALNRLRASGETPNLDQEDFDRATRAEAVLTQLLTFAPLPVPIAKPVAVAAKPAMPFVDVPEAPKHARWAGSVNDSSRPPVKKITFDDDEEPVPVAVKAKQPARRRRKARTDVSSDESSSDSSDSDSSDESSSSNSETESGGGSDSDSDSDSD